MARSYSAGEVKTYIGRTFGFSNLVPDNGDNSTFREVGDKAANQALDNSKQLASKAAKAFGYSSSESIDWKKSNELKTLGDIVGFKIGTRIGELSNNMKAANYRENGGMRFSDLPSEIGKILKEAQEKITAVYNPSSYGGDVTKQDPIMREMGNMQVGSDLYSIGATVYAGILSSAVSGNTTSSNEAMRGVVEKVYQEVSAYSSNNSEAGRQILTALDKIAKIANKDLEVSIAEAKQKLGKA